MYECSDCRDGPITFGMDGKGKYMSKRSCEVVHENQHRSRLEKSRMEIGGTFIILYLGEANRRSEVLPHSCVGQKMALFHFLLFLRILLTI